MPQARRAESLTALFDPPNPMKSAGRKIGSFRLIAEWELRTIVTTAGIDVMSRTP